MRGRKAKRREIENVRWGKEKQHGREGGRVKRLNRRGAKERNTSREVRYHLQRRRTNTEINIAKTKSMPYKNHKPQHAMSILQSFLSLSFSCFPPFPLAFPSHSNAASRRPAHMQHYYLASCTPFPILPPSLPPFHSRAKNSARPPCGK